MHLEKLEIQGFKSFAQKNILVFPGMLDHGRRGITAIVGPNGSGKSNVADAVRWVLGEQSMKTLRGKKSEDVIFSGSAKLGRLGMAEVSLFLNNEDGQAPIDYSQVVLTRRLYRDGASEYLINNNRARLVDIQIMLAKASFGQRTYSVIGQGMVEGFLNTSLAERKEFFDEATGIKQYQIKRDEALGKLMLSYDNLGQAQMIVAEIEPRLRSLTKQVKRRERRGEIETELKNLQLGYYRSVWHDINDKFNSLNRQIIDLEKAKLEKEKKLGQLNQKLGALGQEKTADEHFAELQNELGKLQNQKDGITKQIARLDAQLELKLESSGQFDLSWLKSKHEELAADTKLLDSEIATLAGNVEKSRAVAAELKQEQLAAGDKIRALSHSLFSANTGPGTLESKRLASDLKSLFAKLESAERESDLGQIKIILAEIKADMAHLVELAEKSGGAADLEATRAALDTLTVEQEALAARLNERNQELFAQGERLKLLEEKKHRLVEEASTIEQKLKARLGKVDLGELSRERERLMVEQADLETRLKTVQSQAGELAQKEAAGRNQLFELQKNAQKLQQELNEISRELGELKINSTRFETRLEDLETEIRRELGGLKDIQAEKNTAVLELEPTAEKISALKRQLDLIGGIDPEVEKEYAETQERFDFLANQTSDLENTIESLEQVIKELDVIIKERFDKEFKVISEKFEEYFRILFSGGQAKIIKVMEGEEEEEEAATPEAEAAAAAAAKKTLAEDERAMKIRRIKYLQKHNATGLAGIEIQATPPGKKIKSIAMLSGGERALTAIALICAIINVNPSPFVVLDEVDAALDEANSERLAKILDDLSHKSQFIVITHNRASMRRANVLYGITMGEDGVSKLLSIKLDEAEAKIAR